MLRAEVSRLVCTVHIRPAGVVHAAAGQMLPCILVGFRETHPSQMCQTVTDAFQAKGVKAEQKISTFLLAVVMVFISSSIFSKFTSILFLSQPH